MNPNELISKVFDYVSLYSKLRHTVSDDLLDLLINMEAELRESGINIGNIRSFAINGKDSEHETH